MSELAAAGVGARDRDRVTLLISPESRAPRGSEGASLTSVSVPCRLRALLLAFLDFAGGVGTNSTSLLSLSVSAGASPGLTLRLGFGLLPSASVL